MKKPKRQSRSGHRRLSQPNRAEPSQARTNPAVPFRVYAAAFFLLFTALCLWAARHDSVTVDEFATVPAGYVKLTHPGEVNWLNQFNPPLVQGLLALPWLSLGPAMDPAWWAAAQPELRWALGYKFMAANAPNYDHLFFLSRLVGIALGLLLIFYAWKWSTELFGPTAGLLTLGLCALSPTLIAHSHLATVDIGATAFLVMACYYYWRLLQAPLSSRRWATLLFAVSFALALGAKYTTLLCVPVFVALAIREVLRERSWPMARSLLLSALVTAIVVVGILGPLYAFDGIGRPLGANAFTSPTLKALNTGWLADVPNPLPVGYLRGLDAEGARIALRKNEFYFFGDVTHELHPAYFLVALFTKEPLPHLIIAVTGLVLALSSMIRGRRPAKDRASQWFVVFPGLWFFALFSFVIGSNLGIRYVMFSVVCLYVGAGAIAQWMSDRRNGTRLVVAGLALSALSVVRVGPHFISYFNEAVGGPEGGRRILSDSNLDWGQDLKALKSTMRARGADHVFLSYFGPVSPAVYKLPAEPLMNRGDRPGLVAISVHQLNGIDAFDARMPGFVKPYRDRVPVGRAGYSILLFEER